MRWEPPTISLHPIAGTRPRGITADGELDHDLDSRFEAELRLDAKELAEHMMLVDLARNDVARVSTGGTRQVARLLGVDRYSEVMHLVSHVEGTLRPDLDALHAYAASMNMGTLVGAPKIKAAQILRAAGLRVGLHVTPYLQVSTEKYWVDGRLATGRQMLAAVEEVRPAAERLDLAGDCLGCGLVVEPIDRDVRPGPGQRGRNAGQQRDPTGQPHVPRPDDAPQSDHGHGEGDRGGRQRWAPDPPRAGAQRAGEHRGQARAEDQGEAQGPGGRVPHAVRVLGRGGVRHLAEKPEQQRRIGIEVMAQFRPVSIGGKQALHQIVAAQGDEIDLL